MADEVKTLDERIEESRRVCLNNYWCNLRDTARMVLVAISANPDNYDKPAGEVAEHSFDLAQAFMREYKSRGACDYDTPYDESTMFWEVPKE
jgi:hypothetical protein